MARPAALGIRVAARAIDVALMVAANLALGGAIGFGFDWLFVGTALVFAYFVLADVWFGATVGKAALGLRVRGPADARPTLREAAIREAFTVVGSVPFLGTFLALTAWIVIGRGIRRDPAHQGPHDRWAGGTRVVRIHAGMLGRLSG